MQMPAEIISFEIEKYQFKRGPTTIAVLHLRDATPNSPLLQVIDFELNEDQLKKLPTRELSGQACEVTIQELMQGHSTRIRITRGEILSLNRKPF